MRDELMLEKFGDIMDGVLEQNDVRMLIHMPEGTKEPVVQDNIGLGPVVHFFILMNTISSVFDEFRDILDENLEEDFIDEVLKLIKDDIMEKHSV